ncbi:MAG: hypothetical protein Q6370_010385, partial [Candidatus Sigynarchaeota archaeon]
WRSPAPHHSAASHLRRGGGNLFPIIRIQGTARHGTGIDMGHVSKRVGSGRVNYTRKIRETRLLERH